MRERKSKIKQRVFVIVLFIVLILALINIYFADFEREVQKEELNHAVTSLSGLANQGAEIVETKINLSMSFMRNLAEMLEKTKDIQQKENFEYLQNVLEDENLDILRFGIALPNGEAITTAGKSLNVGEREYFRECMKGHEIITGSLKSKIIGEKIIFLAVPIYGENDIVRGVFYGVIECDSFHVYDNIEMGGVKSDMYIIDGDGNYVTNYDAALADTTKANFFDEMKELKKSVSMKEIQDKLASRNPMYVELQRKAGKEYVYITPININGWFAVTVINEESIHGRVHYLADSVSLLMFRVVMTLALFVVLIYYIIWSEKKKAEQMNQELQIRDNIFQVAVSELESQVFLYDARKDEMRFLSNSSYEKIHLPQIIQNVSKELLKYFSETNQKTMEHVLMEMFDDLKNGREESKRRMILTKGEQTYYYGIKVIHFYNTSGEPIRSIGMIYDISENYEKELLLNREKKMRSFFMSDVIGVYEINVTLDKVMGQQGEQYDSDVTYTRILKEFVRKCVAEEFREEVCEKCSIANLRIRFLSGENNFIQEYKYLRKDKTTFWVACEMHLERDAQNGNLLAFVTVRDIDNKKRKELYLEERAIVDPLTKVYNRSAGTQYIVKALAEMNPGETSAFMLLDLDHFKRLNDTLGHMRGDDALKNVAEILMNHFRKYDIVCRLGGDEFVVFIQRIPIEVLDRVLTSLLKKMELDYERGDVKVSITISAGVALVPEHGNTFEELYEKADQALYQVKNTTRNAYKIYEELLASIRGR